MKHAIGIDLGGTKMALVSGDVAVWLPTGSHFTPERCIEAIQEHGGSPEYIGVAVPGIVDETGTVVACDVLPGLQGWNIPASFPQAHVSVCNDVDAARIEETHDLPHHHSAIVVMVGTAVGASLVIAGQPVRGASGWAGELGYWPIPQDGKGVRLDALAGGDALARAVGCAPHALPQLLAQHDPNAVHHLHHAALTLGVTLAGLLNLLNPHLMVVGGGTWGLPGYAETALAALRSYALPAAWDACTVRAPRSGPWCAARGALRLAVGTG